MHHFGFRQAAQVVHPWERCPPPIRRWSGVEIGQVEAALNTFSDIHTVRPCLYRRTYGKWCCVSYAYSAKGTQVLMVFRV